MRVAYLAAGAGGMYCGSCLRDNRLAASLIAQGRDVSLIPLYTPIRTDEEDVSQSRVYYGGLNVFLQQKSALFRVMPNWMGRWLDAPVLLRRIMRFAGDTRPSLLGELAISVLRGEHGAQRKELGKLIEGLRVLKPDVVNLPNLMFAGIASRLKTELGIPIVCTLTGEDIFLEQLLPSHRQEVLDLIAERSRDVDAFVAVTAYFGSFATEYFRLPEERVHVVPLGINAHDLATSSCPSPEGFTIGYLARICPEKGLDQLCEALAILREAGRNCRVRAAGYLGSRDRVYLDKIHRQIRKRNLSDVFEYVGEVDRAGKREFLQSLHVLSVPTAYHEAKGLFVLEAMASGVPVVQPRHGSFPEIVQATGGGVLYDPTGPRALADAIAGVMDDPESRVRMAEAGRAAVRERFTDEIMANQMWALYERVHSDGLTVPE